MGKSTISMAIFNSYVKLPEGTSKSSNKKAIHPHHSTSDARSHQFHGNLVIDVRLLQGNLTFWYIRPPKKTAIGEFQCVPTKWVAKISVSIFWFFWVITTKSVDLSFFTFFHPSHPRKTGHDPTQPCQTQRLDMWQTSFPPHQLHGWEVLCKWTSHYPLVMSK